MPPQESEPTQGFIKAIGTELENAMRAKYPLLSLDGILIRHQNNPFIQYIQNEVGRKRHGYLLSHREPKGKQGIESLCWLLQPQDFELIFDSEETVRRTIGSDFSPLFIKRFTYQIADTAIYCQGRAVAELMYQLLHEPATFNNDLIHSERRFFDYVTISGYQFSSKPEPGDHIFLPNMPTVADMVSSLQDKGLFKGGYEPPNNSVKPFAELLKLVLAGKAPEPDNVLSTLYQKHYK